MKRKLGVYAPVVNVQRCNQCGLCVKVCPVIADSGALNKFVFGQRPSENLLGNYITCYVGYSTDPRLRWNSASGGLISTLLIFAKKKGIIDAAITTRMNERRPLEPQVTIAQSEIEIIESSKSKYCPVCAGAKIKEVFRENGRYAFVGLPCHIQGVRKAESIFKELNSRIYLHMGIFCLHNLTFEGTDFLLGKVGIRKEDVRKLDYRGEGWPGKISITLKNGDKKYFPYRLVWSALFGSFFFTPFYCTICNDMTSELADISFGDAWLPEFKSDREGMSMIISRTERGEDLLRLAQDEGKIKLQEISKEKVLEAHRLGIIFKKRNLTARIKLLNHFGCNSMVYKSLRLLEPKTADYILAPLLYFNMKISSNQYLVKFLKYVPIPLLKSYTLIFNMIRSLAV